jgi:hypothetical protein
MARLLMYVVDAILTHLRQIVIQFVEFTLSAPPVELVRPMRNKPTQIVEISALRPGWTRSSTREKRIAKPTPEITQFSVIDRDRKRFLSHTPSLADVEGISWRVRLATGRSHI